VPVRVVPCSYTHHVLPTRPLKRAIRRCVSAIPARGTRAGSPCHAFFNELLPCRRHAPRVKGGAAPRVKGGHAPRVKGGHAPRVKGRARGSGWEWRCSSRRTRDSNSPASASLPPLAKPGEMRARADQPFPNGMGSDRTPLWGGVGHHTTAEGRSRGRQCGFRRSPARSRDARRPARNAAAASPLAPSVHLIPSCESIVWKPALGRGPPSGLPATPEARRFVLVTTPLPDAFEQPLYVRVDRRNGTGARDLQAGAG
jgi:hypothetical protein